MTILRNPYTIVLLVLLMMTLGAFFLKLIPYPVGILVLIALLMMRSRVWVMVEAVRVKGRINSSLDSPPK